MTKAYRQPYFIYLLLVTFLGLIPVLWGLVNITNYTPILNFLLLVTVSVIAQSASTSVPVAGKAGVTYAIGHIISLAVVPIYGPAAAALVEAIAGLSQWLLKPMNKTTWKRSWKQLGFNTGMFSLSIFVAGWSLIWLQNWLGSNTVLGETLPWFIAALINDQMNLFLLVGILYLQQNQNINPLSLWKENLWASQIQLIITAIGSAILAFAVQQYDWVAIIIFSLPIVGSGYAFRLYVQQMKAHMDNLENIIDVRTKELQNVMKEKDAFLAVLTHDMKTPLTSIGIYGEMLQKHPDLIAKKPHMATIITQSQKTLLDIVNNILDLEKLSVDGSLPMDMENFDLVPIVEKMVETLRPQAMQKEICLTAQLNPYPIIINADRHQIERVMQNLISNAVKYTPQEGEVKVSLGQDEQNITIEVSDNGYGIPKEELPFVFDRYHRVAKHRTKAAGTGLGLAITQQLVQAHGGHITVTSTEGAGTTITIQFPLPSNSNNSEI